MNKYFKNFILCGDINQHCLLCKESFYLITDIEKHIRWENHRRLIKKQVLVPKFRKDLIYKLENGYYCEICNKIKCNMASVKDHVKSEEHNLLKANPNAKIKKPAGSYDSGYVVIEKVILNQAQWNSIVDNKCFICNVNVANVSQHAASHEHIIRLIQAETKYTDNRYFRKINEQTYHCFACKKIFSDEDFDNHWGSCENKDDIQIKNLRKSKFDKTLINSITKNIKITQKIDKRLLETFQEFYLLDEIKNEAVCIYCETNVKINLSDLVEHIKYGHDAEAMLYERSPDDSEEEVVYSEFTDCGKKRSILKRYATKRDIKLNPGGAKGYCMVCDKFILSHKSNFKQHCSGVIHRGILELHGRRRPKPHDTYFTYETIPINDFIEYLTYSPQVNSVVVNDAYLIEMKSFLLLCAYRSKLQVPKTKCFVCDEVFDLKDERKHCMSPKHINNYADTHMILNSDQFLRVLRPNLYHCGFCNTILPYWDVLQMHLKTERHEKLRWEVGFATHAMSLWSKFNPTFVDITTGGDEDMYKELMSRGQYL